MPNRRCRKTKWATKRVIKENTFLQINNIQSVLHCGPVQLHATLEAASTTAAPIQSNFR
jgi:hypothetical protein